MYDNAKSCVKYMAIRADCNSMRDSAKITVSSAYSNKYNFKNTDNSSVSRKINGEVINIEDDFYIFRNCIYVK
jgi:hypothetical protein